MVGMFSNTPFPSGFSIHPQCHFEMKRTVKARELVVSRIYLQPRKCEKYCLKGYETLKKETTRSPFKPCSSYLLCLSKLLCKRGNLLVQAEVRCSPPVIPLERPPTSVKIPHSRLFPLSDARLFDGSLSRPFTCGLSYSFPNYMQCKSEVCREVFSTREHQKRKREYLPDPAAVGSFTRFSLSHLRLSLAHRIPLTFQKGTAGNHRARHNNIELIRRHSKLPYANNSIRDESEIMGSSHIHYLPRATMSEIVKEPVSLVNFVHLLD